MNSVAGEWRRGYRRGPCGREQLRRRKEDADQRHREDVLGGEEGGGKGSAGIFRSACSPRRFL